MSTQPPPGWYPDPTTTAPARERWWDGVAWTEHSRVPPAAPGDFGAAGSPPGTPVPGAGAVSGGRARRSRVVAVVAAGAVLVAAIVVGGILIGRGDNTSPTAVTSSAATDNGRTPPTRSVTRSSGPADGPTSGSSPDAGSSLVTDELNGITVPLPEGWQRPKYVSPDDVLMTTAGHYDCPGDSGVCWHGMLVSRTVTDNSQTSPEALAKGDIAHAAQEGYGRNSLDEAPYGGITAHEVVAERQVAVAGRAGYLVRWRVHTAKGSGGYVQSLVFPSSVGTEAPVVMRFFFDAGKGGPALSVMDAIVRSIRPVGDTGADGGVGSSIAPATRTPGG